MKRRLLSIALALVMVLACLPMAFAEEKVGIEFWYGWGGNLGKLMQSMIEDYNASQDKYVVTGVQFDSYGTINKNYQAALAADNPPAAIQLTSYGNFEPYLEALNDRYENDTSFNVSDLLGGPLNCMYGLDGKSILGVPLYTTTQLMYYRKDAFAGYDIDETFSTWQNVAKAAAELTKKDENGAVTRYGWMPMWGSNNLIDAAMCAGAQLYADSEQRKVDFLTDEWYDVMESFRKWLHDDQIMGIHFGGTGWEYWYATIDDVLADRAAGYCGSIADQGDLDFNIVGVYMLPGWEGTELRPHSNSHRGVISSRASDEQKDAAWDFLKFVNSAPCQARIAMTSGYAPTRRSTMDDPDFKAYCDTHTYLADALDAVDKSVPMWVDITGGYIDTAMEDLADRIEIENMDTREALQLCQEEAQSALDDYWANQQ